VEVAPNKITIGKTNTVNGMAYSGNIQLDNVRVFTGDKPTMAATNPNATDFEEFKYVAGKNIGMAKLPSLATIETLTDGNTVFRVDMAPAGSADSYVLMQASGANAAKATLSGAFEWNLADKTQGTLNGEAITLVQNGSNYEYTVNDAVYRVVSAAVAGASIGDANVCTPSKRTHSTFSYATDRTITLSADYFIEEGSTGIIESQFEKYYYGEERKGSTYFDLYKIYMDTGRIDNGLYFNIGEWNNVTVIFDLVAGEAEIYVNGVYSHTQTDKDGNVIQDFGASIWDYKTQYLSPRITIKPYAKSGTYTVYVKLYKNGELSTGTNSPTGYSYSTTVTVSGSSSQVVRLSGWGSSTSGHWPIADYRFEVWYGDYCIGSKSFKVI
jgi:hypothetical protein